MSIEDLDRWARVAWMEFSAAQSVAITVGCQAARLGMSEHDLRKWLQVAYGSIFVRMADLKPEFALKELAQILIQAHRSEMRRIVERRNV